MQALSWALQYPDVSPRAGEIAAAPKLTAQNIALQRGLPAELILGRSAVPCVAITASTAAWCRPGPAVSRSAWSRSITTYLRTMRWPEDSAASCATAKPRAVRYDVEVRDPGPTLRLPGDKFAGLLRDANTHLLTTKTPRLFRPDASVCAWWRLTPHPVSRSSSAEIPSVVMHCLTGYGDGATALSKEIVNAVCCTRQAG